MLRKLVKYTIFILLFIFILAHVAPFFEYFSEFLVKKVSKYNYIAHINTPSYTNKRTEKVLDIFNNMSYNKKAVNKKGYRPIFIIEKDLKKENNETILGLAYPLPAYCLIVMNKGLDKDTYFYTLLHEYVHCYGYDHPCKYCDDLMSAYYLGRVNYLSVFIWSQQIGYDNE